MGKISNYIEFGHWKKLAKRLQKRKEKDIVELKTLQLYESSTLPSFSSPNNTQPRRYLIHQACLNGINRSGMKAILDVYPEAVALKDDEGSTPLHYLLHYDEYCKLDVLQLLLDVYPEALNIRDNYGCTPVYHAVEHNIGVRIEFLALLLRSKEGVDALTTPCNLPQQMGQRRGRKELIAPKRQSVFPETPRNDLAYRRTPLYMIWDIAMNAKDTTRFGVRIPNINKRERKKIGKRLEKAQMMLEASYLSRTIDPQMFNSRFVEVKGHHRFHVPLKHRLIRRRSTKMEKLKSKVSGTRVPEDNLGETFDSERSMQNNDIVPRGKQIKPRPLLMETRKTKSSFALFKRRFKMKSMILKRGKSDNDSVQDAAVTIRSTPIPITQYASTSDNNVRSSRSLHDSNEDSRNHITQIGKRDNFANLIHVNHGENKFRVMHAVLTLSTYLPESAYDYAIVHYPDQVKEAEEQTGNYPLHIACTIDSSSDFDRDEILKELIELNKDAAREENRAGRLPLHIALSDEDPWSFESMKILMDSFAGAFEKVDPSSNLYPFQIAALDEAKSENQLSIVYKLLNEAPGVMEQIVNKNFATSTKNSIEHQNVLLENEIDGEVKAEPNDSQQRLAENSSLVTESFKSSENHYESNETDFIEEKKDTEVLVEAAVTVMNKSTSNEFLPSQ